MHLIDTHAKLVSSGGDLAIERTQFLGDDFFESLRSERLAKQHMRAAETDRVASVPAQLVDVWLRQGFDFWRATPREIVQRLERENLQAFITTDKRV